MNVVEQAIARMRDAATDEDAGWFASSVVERAYSNGKGSGDRGWPDAVAEADLSPEDLEPLWNALVEMAGGDLRRPEIGAIAWVLGKSHQERFYDLYCEILRANLDGDPNGLYQALIALNNLGEMPQYPSWVASDIEGNRIRAREFLRIEGLVAPAVRRASERLLQAIQDCSAADARAALADGADPNYAIPMSPSMDADIHQPDTPLKLVMFRISDSFVDDDGLRACADIARELVAAGGDPGPAMALAEQRYGPYDPDATGLFADVWHVIARAVPGS